MKIVDRYLIKTITHTTGLVLLMLASLTFFITILREISTIGTGTYGLIGAIEYVLMDLPSRLYTLFPIAALIGTVLGLSLLANHHELTILRVSGMSLYRIAQIVIKAMLLMLVLATLIGEWLAPMAQNLADTHKALLTSSGQTLTTREGTWMRDGHNYIYIRQILDNHHLNGISLYEFDEKNNLIRASYAKSGFYQKKYWYMQNISSSDISLNKINSTQSESALWKLSISPKVLNIAAVDAEEMSLKQLFYYIQYLKNNKLSSNDYSLVFWQRLLQPVATLVMVWLAIPFVFGSLRSATLGLRLMMGVIIGFAFYMLNQFFGPLSIVYQWPPFIAAIFPTLLFSITAYFLMQRAS